LMEIGDDFANEDSEEKKENSPHEIDVEEC
jgi:hypothetical protein